MNILLVCLVLLLASSTLCCSVFCTYTNDSSHTGRCVSQTPIGCTQCDSLLFVLNPPAGPSGPCVAHQQFNEYLDIIDASYGSYTGSFSTTTYFGIPSLQFPCVSFGRAVGSYAITNPHYALRMRFFIYRSSASPNSFSFQYGMDGNIVTYSQPSNVYNASDDIVTTGLYNHQGPSVGVSFVLSSCTLPCCVQYLLIKEVLIFVSRCSPGCLTCSALTTCSNCTVLVNGSQTYLYDNGCYVSCPRATYPSVLSLLIGMATQPQPSCLPCPILCEECINSTNCTICFNEGRNESYLFYHVCYAACPFGYQPNYDLQMCVCPSVSFYQLIVLGVPTSCTPCAIECLTCIGTTNILCTRCKPSYYLAFGSTACEIGCPGNQYIFQNSNECALCDSSCASCLTTATHCTSCLGLSKYLLGGVCVRVCPLGYTMRNDTYVCEVCAPFTYSYWGVCLTNCPPYHMAYVFNSSCLPLSATNYTLTTTISTVSLINHGRVLHFSVFFSDGLNATSIAHAWKNAYKYVTIMVTVPSNRLLQQVVPSNRLLQQVVPSNRLLQQVVLPAVHNTMYNLSVQSLSITPNTIQFYTSVPALTPSMQFVVSYSLLLYSTHDIPYTPLSTSYPLSTSLYYSYLTTQVTNLYNLILVAPILLLFILLLTRVPTTYQLLLQSLRYIQLIALLVYSVTPSPTNLFFFLLGADYSNMDFLPNLYVLLAEPTVGTSLSAYVLYTPDMDFLRLLGGVIIFILVWSPAILIAHLCFKAQTVTVKWMGFLMIDILQVKILYSFWGSLLNIMFESRTTTFSLYIVHFCSYLLLTGVFLNHYLRDSKVRRALLLYRVCATLLLATVTYLPLLFTTIFSLVSFATTLYTLYHIYYPTPYPYHMEYIECIYQDDGKVRYSSVIPIRNYYVAALPMCTALSVAVIVLLANSTYVVVILTLIAIALCTLTTVLYALARRFVEERNSFVTQCEVEKVKVTYNKVEDTVVSPQRRFTIDTTVQDMYNDDAVNQRFRRKLSKEDGSIGISRSNKNNEPQDTGRTNPMDQFVRSNTSKNDKYNDIRSPVSPKKQSITTRNNKELTIMPTKAFEEEQ